MPLEAPYATADTAMVWRNAGAPTNGTSGTFAGIVNPGGLLIDYTNSKLYQNQNTQASPTWVLVGVLDSAGHLSVPAGTAPTAAAGANNGTTPPAPVVAAAATDAAGTLTFGSGGSAAAGAQVVVTFGTAMAAAPKAVVAVALNDATQVLGVFVSSVGTAGFTVSTHTAPTASQAATVYSVAWVAIGQ